MLTSQRLQYYRRIARAYLVPGESQLSFWHDAAEMNPSAVFTNALGEYYMTFAEKAEYAGPCDDRGVPLLNYHGQIGLQYNPIAVAQWGLGNFNRFRRGDDVARGKALLAGDWLCERLQTNAHGIHVWNHYFDWEYRKTLKAPWHSGLAQGQGISLLVRLHAATGEAKYLDAASRALRSFLADTESGGVTFHDEAGDVWFEEYILSPPTHILNGFIWAVWGIYDYFLATGDGEARDLFASAVKTLAKNLDRYDLGFWSRYELSGTRMPMIASPFYHRLHVTQLRVMHKMTGDEVFARYAEKWEKYGRSGSKRARALCYKGAFKLCYY